MNYLKDKLPWVLFCHVPAEGRKTPFERYKHSIMGNLKGMPDFLIFYPKLAGKPPEQELLFLGLLIELKTPEHTRVVLKGKKIDEDSGLEVEVVLDPGSKPVHSYYPLWPHPDRLSPQMISDFILDAQFWIERIPDDIRSEWDEIV